jgi:hypothetical protein
LPIFGIVDAYAPIPNLNALENTGRWNISNGAKILDQGSLNSFNASAWHRLQLNVTGTSIVASIDNATVTRTQDSANRAGWVGIGTASFTYVQFDNLQMDADFASGGWCGQGSNVAAGGCWSGQPTSDQQWQLSDHDGTLRLINNSTLCLTVDKSNRGATLQTCQSPTPATQVWLYNESIQALQSSGLCLGTTSGSANLCAVASMYKCNGVLSNRWVFATNHTIQAPISGYCLTAASATGY